MRMKLLFIIGLAAVCFTDVFAGPPIMVEGSEATDGIIYLHADDGDDATDRWELHADLTLGTLEFLNADVLRFSFLTNGSMSSASLALTGNGSVAGTLVVTGALTTIAGMIETPTTITNAPGVYTQTVSAAFYKLTPTTGVITQHLANGTDGQRVEFFNSLATNVMWLDADSNLDLGGRNYTNSITDGMIFRSLSNVWYLEENMDR